MGIISYFKKQRAKRRLVFLVRFVYSQLYSDNHVPFYEDADDKIFLALEKQYPNPNDRLWAYITIPFFLYERKSLEDIDFDRLLKISYNALHDSLLENNITQAINKHQVKTGEWITFTNAHILKTKKAYQCNPYSYGGMIYRTEKSQKYPCSENQKVEFRKIADELKRLDALENEILNKNKFTTS